MPQYSLEARAALDRLSRRGHRINTIIDVGAAEGKWSADASYIWPHSHFLLIEANDHHVPALEHCKKQAPDRIEYILAAASDHTGTTSFFTSQDPLGGGVWTGPREAYPEVPAITIDDAIAQRHLPDPFLIKLDTHGHELEILSGATATLARTGVLVIETYFFRFGKRVPLFYELCAFLAERGFGCVDIVEPAWRNYDQALWQLDLVFVPLASSEFKHLLFD